MSRHRVPDTGDALPPWLVQRIGGALPASHDDDALSRVGSNLRRRAAGSVVREDGLHTVRCADARWSNVADGLRTRELYRSADPSALRPGEPSAVEIWHLGAGFEVTLPPDTAVEVEWLLLSGQVEVDGRPWRAVSCIRSEQGLRARSLRSAPGALLYRRIAPVARDDHRGAENVAAGRPLQWQPLLDGVDRLVLWSDGEQEAYIIRARAGAAAPAHEHVRDEECLVLEGELYFGDQLMRAGDFQLAPAGCTHSVIEAATDALLYQRGEVKR